MKRVDTLQIVYFLDMQPPDIKGATVVCLLVTLKVGRHIRIRYLDMFPSTITIMIMVRE